LKLKRIRGNEIRKFYWNKKIVNVKKLGAATSKYKKKKICIPNIIRKTMESI